MASSRCSVVLNKVRDGKGNYGFNAQTGEYTDMIKAGILDRTKVVRTAAQAGTRVRFGRRPRSARVEPWRVQNAASIAGLMITTEATVAEMPKKDEPMGGGGDMGGMGGMM